MASLVSISDDFGDGVRAAIWTDLASGAGVTSESGGVLICTPPVSNATVSSAGYGTAGTYDLTGLTAPNCPRVKLLQVPTGDVNMFTYFLLFLDANNYFYWLVNNGTISINKVVAGVGALISSTAYNSSTHKWLGFQESAGATYFISSSDGLVWTVFSGTGYANFFAVTALSAQLKIVSIVSLASPGAAQFDNFNLLEGPGPSQTAPLVAMQTPQQAFPVY